MTAKRRHTAWIPAGAAVTALFLFFHCALPYHLFHREQTQLFLLAEEPLLDYLRHTAALSKLAGDFLTQFFYYIGIGPAILALVLTLWGYVVRRLLHPYAGRWAWAISAVAVLWEAGRQCGLDYPLSATLSLTGLGCVLLACRAVLRRSRKWGIPASLLLIAAGYWSFGLGQWTPIYNLPDFGREHLLAIDSEYYFGRTDRAERLLDDPQRRNPLTAYYRNLLNARRGCLADSLMHTYQPAAEGLLLPVGPAQNYLSLYAANEAWFELGDMTLAEHAAMLGMVFSPRHTGTRAMRRLAEINLINGDTAAAMKYLRLLQKTICHRDWASRRIPGQQTDDVERWLERRRASIPPEDTLRSANDVPRSLRHLLEACPRNAKARDYLLCFDLLNKDIPAFVNDYDRYAADQPPCRLYTEALLVHLANRKATPEELSRRHIPSDVLSDFNDYTRLYEAHQGDAAALQSRYRHTYWFYFHYAVKKK